MITGPNPSHESAPKRTHVRYLIVLMLFAASAFSYGDRVVLSIAGLAMAKDLHLDPLRLGYLFSGFSWAYVVGQLPAVATCGEYGSYRRPASRLIASYCAIQRRVWAVPLSNTSAVGRRLRQAPGGKPVGIPEAGASTK